MSNEQPPAKFWLKSTATIGAVLLGAAGLSVASKELIDRYNAHPKIAKITHDPSFANYPIDPAETEYVKKDFDKFVTSWTHLQPKMKHVSLELVLSGNTTCKSNFFKGNEISSSNIN